MNLIYRQVRCRSGAIWWAPEGSCLSQDTMRSSDIIGRLEAINIASSLFRDSYHGSCGTGDTAFFLFAELHRDLGLPVSSGADPQGKQ